MTKPRRDLVSLSDTPYYHCVSRCVRRAFLCGEDRYSGRDFSHRKGWVKDRVAVLSEIFAVDICAYAVMSNHFHLVLHVDADRADGWSNEEVIERWRRLFKGSPLAARFLAGDELLESESEELMELAARWRARLRDMSWFMRCLNEHIARMANAEDGCTGRFWEGRYKCQALLDDVAVVTALAYVDLNPIRAGAASGLFDSADTSVQQRLLEIENESDTQRARIPLMDFSGMERLPAGNRLPIGVQDYLDLVDWTGRAVRPDKRGFIDEARPPILTNLGIQPAEWLPTVTALQERFELVIGSPRRIRALAAATGRRFFRGCSMATRLYGRPLAA